MMCHDKRIRVTRFLKTTSAFTALMLGIFAHEQAYAQSSSALVVSSCGSQSLVAGNNRAVSQDTTGTLCSGAAGGGASTVQGNVSNANSGIATTSTNVPSVSYNYGFNGTTWDQMQVDASKFLKTDDTGNVASGAADSGNPVKVGGVYKTTLPVLTNGQRGDNQLGVDGSLRAMDVAFSSSGVLHSGIVVNLGFTGTPASSTLGSMTATSNLLYNGTSLDQSVGIVGAAASGVGSTAITQAPTNVAAGAPGTPVTGQTITSLIVKGAADNLYGFNVVSGTTAGFIVVNNTTTAPGGGGATTPLYCVPLAASSGYTWRSDIPLNASVGITLLFSTSCGTYTAVSPAATFMQGEAP